MKKLLCIVIVFLGYHSSFAQTEEQYVQEAIEIMFDGMRAADSAMVHSVFTDEVVMRTILKNQSGQVRISKATLSNFLEVVGTPHDAVFDERIISYDIKIDGELASVWTPYEFYLGEKFSHKGVNSFQLAKLDGKWKIIYLVDTRRR